MKILVAVKRVVDYNIKVRAKEDGSKVADESLKKGLNPFDEIAIEAALQLKEQGLATEVVVVTIGNEQCQDVLRTALALGADRAILVHSHMVDVAGVPLNRAKVLAYISQKEAVDVAILGKQAIDDDCAQTPQMLAALLNWPQASFASKITLEERSGMKELIVTREVDFGLTTVALELPAVVSVDLRLNEPRFATLPNIMKAKKKPLEEMDSESMDIEWVKPYQVFKVSEPVARVTTVEKLDSVEALVAKLRDEVKVI